MSTTSSIETGDSLAIEILATPEDVSAPVNFTSGYESDSSDVVIVTGPFPLVSAQDMAHAMGGESHAAPVVTQAPAFVMLSVDPGNPWLSDVAYGIVPSQALEANPSSSSSPTGHWYSVTKGRWVGVFSISSLAADAVDGVSGNARLKFSSREAALQHFNSTLGYGLVEIRQPKVSASSARRT
ncbi:hypothetical protein C8J56DRAFT_891810 [Mycena floridula]|nr:hypothetical protein C8J56DRAFT_891810 [Mycena floridula]